MKRQNHFTTETKVKCILGQNLETDRNPEPSAGLPKYPSELVKAGSSTGQSGHSVDMAAAASSSQDHTLGFEICCSLETCLIKQPIDLFGCPSDLTLRMKWMDKCGFEIDPTDEEEVRRLRICRVHFDADCFDNNELRPDAIPSLFLDNDIIHPRDIPTSSNANSWFVYVDEPSRFSSPGFPPHSDYAIGDEIQNEERLLRIFNNHLRELKDDEPYCSIPGCITNTKEEDEDILIFRPQINTVFEWSMALEMQLTLSSSVCERHFRPQDLDIEEVMVNGVKKTLKGIKPFSLPFGAEQSNVGNYSIGSPGFWGEVSEAAPHLKVNHTQKVQSPCGGATRKNIFKYNIYKYIKPHIAHPPPIITTIIFHSLCFWFRVPQNILS